MQLENGKGMSKNTVKEKDIFDRIMENHIFHIFQSFYKKYKEILLYLFFGVLTMVVSVVSYAICNMVFEINALVANIIAWILAVLFAFYTNRIWVFGVKTNSKRDFIIQIFSFCSGRIITLILEEVILFIFITCLHYRSMRVKIVAQIFVIVLNYIISKFWIFNE